MMSSCTAATKSTGRDDLLDYLVGKREQSVGHIEAERLRRPKVYDHLKLGRQQRRKVGSLLALEDATSVAASQAIHLGQVRPIGDEAAGAGKFPVRIHCRHRVARGECDDRLPASGEQRVAR